MVKWQDARQIEPNGWTCGHCGCRVGGNVGYKELEQGQRIYICPSCGCPTAFVPGPGGFRSQFPRPTARREIRGVPELVASLWDEAGLCLDAGATTGCALCLRKLLMHVAVDLGAEPGRRFVDYVTFLGSEGYVSPRGMEWVDELRRRGNEAAHEIVMTSERDASRLMRFAEVLLVTVYEFPAEVRD